MIPFPTDREIVAAIQLLARGNVLRRFYVRNAVGRELFERYHGAETSLRERVERDVRQRMSAELVDVLAGPGEWSSDPVGFHRCEVCETSGWVIAYADARRALDQAPVKE